MYRRHRPTVVILFTNSFITAKVRVLEADAVPSTRNGPVYCAVGHCHYLFFLCVCVCVWMCLRVYLGTTFRVGSFGGERYNHLFCYHYHKIIMKLNHHGVEMSRTDREWWVHSCISIELVEHTYWGERYEWVCVVCEE